MKISSPLVTDGRATKTKWKFTEFIEKENSQRRNSFSETKGKLHEKKKKQMKRN